MKFKYVHLETPYDSWNSEQTRDLFCKVIKTKIDGYSGSYRYGILPMDGTDFVGTHLLVCEELDSGELSPVATYKSVTLERTVLHSLPFPCLALCQGSHAPEHAAVVEGLMEKYRERPWEISYESGFTIRPDLRADRELVHTINDHLAGLVGNFVKHAGLKCMLAMGMTKVRGDRYFMKWGFEPFSNAEGELPLVNVRSHFFEPCRLFRLENYSDYLAEKTQQSQLMWKNRLWIPAAKAPLQRQAVA